MVEVFVGLNTDFQIGVLPLFSDGFLMNQKGGYQRFHSKKDFLGWGTATLD